MQSNLNFRWLTEAHAEPLQLEWEGRGDFCATTLPMVEGMGYSSLDYMRLALKMEVCQISHHFAPGMPGQWLPMAEIAGKSSEPQFLVREFMNGKSMLHDRRLDRKLYDELRRSTFHLFEAIDLQVWLNSGEDVAMAMLKMDISTLYNLIGEAYTQNLLKGLNLGKAQVTSLQPLPPEITRLLHSGFSGHLAGSMRRLQAQAKVLEYLVALSGHFADSKGSRREVCKTQRFGDLREELRNLQGNLPNLEELARRYGVSARTLNEQFKREFQQSLYSFIVHERLNAAHAALTHGKQSIKVIACAVGFSNVSSFTKAFSKSFGYPPGSLRRGG